MSVWCEHCRDHYPEEHYDEDGNHFVGKEWGPTGEGLALRRSMSEDGGGVSRGRTELIELLLKHGAGDERATAIALEFFHPALKPQRLERERAAFREQVGDFKADWLTDFAGDDYAEFVGVIAYQTALGDERRRRAAKKLLHHHSPSYGPGSVRHVWIRKHLFLTSHGLFWCSPGFPAGGNLKTILRWWR